MSHGFIAQRAIAYSDVAASLEEATLRCQLDPACSGFSYRGHDESTHGHGGATLAFPRAVAFSQVKDLADSGAFVPSPGWVTHAAPGLARKALAANAKNILEESRDKSEPAPPSDAAFDEALDLGFPGLLPAEDR